MHRSESVVLIVVVASVVVAVEVVALVPTVASFSGCPEGGLVAAAESVLRSTSGYVRVAMVTSAASIVAAGLLMVLMATVL